MPTSKKKKKDKTTSKIWVYSGTAVPYTKSFNLTDLTNTTIDKKSGWITQGTLQKPDGSTHQVELITKAAQIKRQGIWVYAGTSIPFPENVNLLNLTNTITNKKSGWITQGTLQTPDGSTHHIEFITKDTKKHREGIWVYAGTNIPFPENVNRADLTNTSTDKRGGFPQGTIQTPDGSTYRVELITKSARKQRTGTWVYANTNIPFPENINFSNLTNTTTDKKSGLITQATLQMSNGTIANIEFISKKVQRDREGVWVYLGTNIPFPENVNLSNLTNTTIDKKNGWITQGTLQKSDGTTYQVEFITKKALKQREWIWVYAGTGISFPENVNVANLTNTTTDKKSGWITQGTLQTSDGVIHQVEFITKSTQKKREEVVCVYANTGIPFPENVNLSNLTNTTTDKKSGFTQGTLQKLDGTTHRVELITKKAQKDREGVWVYANTGISFPEHVNFSNLTNAITDKKSGFTQGTLQKSDGTTHRVELITKNAQKLREGIWVYANTGIAFPENVNLSNLTNTITNKKSGWITQGTLQKPDGTIHEVEFITKAAQIKRSKRQPDQTPADASTNTTWVPSLFQSLVTDSSNQLEKDEQNKPHKRVKR